MSCHHWIASLLCFAALAAHGTTVSAETVQPSIQDGFAYQFLSNTPLNGAPPFNALLAAGNTNGAGHDLNSFVEFNLGTLPSQVASATLRLFAVSTSAAGFGQNPSPASPITLDVYAVTADWNESTLTWGNKPSFEAVASATATQDGINEEVLFDVTALVNRWLAGNLANEGLAIVQRDPVGPSGARVVGVFASANGVTALNAPALDFVRLAPVPEPTSVVLALCSLPTLAWAARRRLSRA